MKEYWLVEPTGQIERRTGPGLKMHHIVKDRLESPLLPGYRLETTSLSGF